jgi:UDP-3-O-[3-hydroxymyristoyl] glucosamine N-acyltransferase
MEKRLLPRGTSESRTFAERVQHVMGLTARLNALAFEDTAGRTAILREILGRPLPETVTIYPPSGITHAPIVIAEDVWIGAAATICPGVTIGRGSVVGAGTVVAKDVPPMSVVTSAGHIERRQLDS